MPFDAFLYFEGPGNGSMPLLGETQDDVFSKKKAFELKSFSFGAENTTTLGSGTSGGGGGKCAFQKFAVTRNTDNSSPAFFQNCATGTHYKSAMLCLRKSGGGKVSGYVYLTYQFSTVFVTKVTWKGSGGGNEDAPEEDLEFAYGALKVKYQPQKPDGSLGTAVFGSWSQILNKTEDPGLTLS